MASPLKLQLYSDLENYIAAMEREGIAYFPGVLDAVQVAEVRQAIDRLTAMEASFDRDSVSVEGYREKHIKCVFNHDPLFLRFLDMPPVIDLAEAILGILDNKGRQIDCHIIGMTAWITGPGREDQQLHVDWRPFDLPENVAADPRVKLPVMAATAHYYLDDIDEELGPTKFVPGSHRAGHPPNGASQWGDVEEQSVLCKAGDVVMFRSEVWHRGTANRSGRTRYLLQVHYANRMVTQKFPPYLGRFEFDQSILAQATPRQLRLLGDHSPGAYD